jgi:GNAT superfamily N-acetyltransferase
VERANEGDAPELLVLQRCCWMQEALVNDTVDIPALHESLADVRVWVGTWDSWCARRDGRLVGAVRGLVEGSTWHVGRLMVAPDLSGKGLGRWLLAFVESRAPTGTTAYTLFTGARSRRNIDLYQRAGYRVTDVPEGRERPAGTVYLTKPVCPAG